MGGPEFSKQYLEQLEAEIDEQYENFKKHNEGKNIFSSARTPAVLFTVMTFCYVMSSVFGIVGIESFANLLNLVLGLFLILLVMWIYVRYSGEHIGVGQQIDQIAEFIWDKVRQFIFQLQISLVHTDIQSLPMYVNMVKPSGTGHVIRLRYSLLYHLCNVDVHVHYLQESLAERVCALFPYVFLLYWHVCADILKLALIKQPKACKKCRYMWTIMRTQVPVNVI